MKRLATLLPAYLVVLLSLTAVLAPQRASLSTQEPQARMPAGIAPQAAMSEPQEPAHLAVAAVAPYGEIIDNAAQLYGISPRLIHAVIAVESAYRANAISPKGAVGLMQLMPQTAAQYGVADLRDPAANIDVGVRHLRGLLERFDNDLRLTLAAYNAGEGAVLRHGGVPPYPETTRYVVKVLQEYEKFE